MYRILNLWVLGFKIYNSQGLSGTVSGPQKVLFWILVLLRRIEESHLANHLPTLSFFLIVIWPKLYHKVKISLPNLRFLKPSPSDFWEFPMVCSEQLGIYFSSFSSLCKLPGSCLCKLLCSLQPCERKPCCPIWYSITFSPCWSAKTWLYPLMRFYLKLSDNGRETTQWIICTPAAFSSQLQSQYANTKCYWCGQ